jgi:hypothetical protein
MSNHSIDDADAGHVETAVLRPLHERGAQRGWLSRSTHALFRRLQQTVSFLRENLVGSDAFSRNTAVYVWITNQFGHFAVGLIFTFIVTLAAQWVIAHAGYLPPDLVTGTLYGAILVVLVYAGKEYGDVAVETNEAGLDGRPRPFPLPLKELVEDSATDTAFVGLGAVVAHLATYRVVLGEWPWWSWSSAILAALAFFCVREARRVLPCRKRLDNSALPGFARLRRYNGAFREIQLAAQAASPTVPVLPAVPVDSVRLRPGQADSTAAAKRIGDFIHGAGGILVISAEPNKTGRTFLAIALGCEFAARGSGIRYTTWRSAQRPAVDDEQEGALQLDSAEVVILDDCVVALDEVYKRVSNCRLRHLVIVVADETAATIKRACESLQQRAGSTVVSIRITESFKVRQVARRARGGGRTRRAGAAA